MHHGCGAGLSCIHKGWRMDLKRLGFTTRFWAALRNYILLSGDFPASLMSTGLVKVGIVEGGGGAGKGEGEGRRGFLCANSSMERVPSSLDVWLLLGLERYFVVWIFIYLFCGHSLETMMPRTCTISTFLFAL